MKDKVRINPAAVAAAARGDMENFLVAATPGGIEAQEAMGQAALVGTKNTLPIRCPRPDLEKLGFVFGEPCSSDPHELFVNVTFPSGWSKKATDHSMWSDLLDDKGRKRGAIFYKAAFYDRSAHMSLEPRYTCTSQYLNDDLTPFQWRGNAEPSKQWTAVVDHADGKALWHSEPWPHSVRDYKAQDTYKQAGREWLKSNFPEHEDVTAYW